MRYAFFKMNKGRDKGRFFQKVEDFMLTTEEVYRRYDKITAPVPLDGIVYFIAKFDGDPICPKLYTNSNGCLSTISEAEFLKEKAKKETLIELDEVPDLSKKDIETLNRMFKDLEL